VEIYLEDAVQSLAALCETSLRKYGRNIVEQQTPGQSPRRHRHRLLALLGHLARTSRIIEPAQPGESKVEISMTFTFYSDARTRVRSNLRAMHRAQQRRGHPARRRRRRPASGGYKTDILKVRTGAPRGAPG